MTFRSHPITGDPILFAPDRASRPHAFEGNDSKEAERCPFCRGHEADTPSAIATVGDPWRIRVFENKYPALEGAEVIVESPDHEATFDRIAHAEEAVSVYIDRYRAHAGCAHVSLFKNEGPRAGASIPHMHSQVMPLPFVPPRVEREVDAFTRASVCPLCAEIDGHIIKETKSLRWLAPAGSAMPYQQWIVPKRHVQELTALDDVEINELATLLQSASATMLTIGDSYNWLFMNFARRPSAHFYVELFPRLALPGGFEFGTGSFIEIVDPAIAADRLKRGRA